MNSFARTQKDSSALPYRLFAIQFSFFISVAIALLIAFEADRATHSVYSEAERQGRFIFSTLGRQVSDALYFNDIEQVRTAADFVESQNTVRRIAVFSDQGRFLFDSEQTMVPRGGVDQSLYDLTELNEDYAYRFGADSIEFVGAVRFDQLTLGGLYLELDITGQLAAARSSTKELAYFGLAGVALVSAIAFLIAGFVGTTRSLRVVESNFSQLIEQSPLPYSIFRTDGELVYMNAAMAQLMGSRLLPDQAYNILKDQRFDKAGVALTLAEGFSEGPLEIPRFGFRLLEDQGLLWLRGIVFPLRGKDGQTEDVVVAFEDVSSEVQAEERQTQMNAQLVQSQKLEALGVMARGIAHDFNNLLTPVMVSADLLMREPQGATFDRYIQNIISGARRASDLCRQLLAYGGSEEKAIVRTNLSSELEEMNALMSSSVSKNVVFRQSLDKNLPLVSVDHSQVRQIILNLLINASEAVEEQGPGEVMLSTGVRELNSEDVVKLLPAPDLEPGRYVFMEVKDTGVGMDYETQQSLFNPFFSTKFTGRGLGMSVVLGIVRDHKGGIAVESEEAEGTSITIYFPLSDHQQEASQPETQSEQTTLAGGCLLLADDEPEVLDIGRRTLEALGYDVIAATNGEEAIAQFEKHRDQITGAVLDLMMPLVDGETAVNGIRHLKADLPIVIVTGMQSAESFNRLSTMSRLKILNKPYLIKDLEAALRELLV
ncbi:MAG: response regulator [Pseudomonadales bacterium]|nr:response regulator [Pseudomonadales bacterium]MBO6701223.1 response regulator [Pseudomonadales bacterium]MBO7006409.1 response regulator [Pseudomonadales bacterium]